MKFALSEALPIPSPISRPYFVHQETVHGISHIEKHDNYKVAGSSAETTVIVVSQ